MLNTNRDAVVCDFAQYYGVLDVSSLPLLTAATLAQGLPEDSRTVRALAGTGAVTSQTIMLAVIADRLGHIAWMFSDDGAKGVNHPPSILELITGINKNENNAGFDTGEDFMAAWAAFAGGD